MPAKTHPVVAAMAEIAAALAKTPTRRVQELRQRREALGLTRLELYVHPEDHESIKAHAAKLQRKRERAARAALDKSAKQV
jgi:hypothetical protein